MTDVTPCVDRDRGYCESFLPGHHTHWIHAKHIGRTPWGWRDAVVCCRSRRLTMSASLSVETV